MVCPDFGNDIFSDIEMGLIIESPKEQQSTFKICSCGRDDFVRRVLRIVGLLETKPFINFLYSKHVPFVEHLRGQLIDSSYDAKKIGCVNLYPATFRS